MASVLVAALFHCVYLPLSFLPERWLRDDRAELPRLAYFPFGAGSRICIGEGFAWLEGVLTIALLASRWRFELLPGQVVVPNPTLTLRPRQGIDVWAHRRRGTARAALA
jgi:cytochrome P450